MLYGFGTVLCVFFILNKIQGEMMIKLERIFFFVTKQLVNVNLKDRYLSSLYMYCNKIYNTPIISLDNYRCKSIYE